MKHWWTNVTIYMKHEWTNETTIHFWEKTYRVQLLLIQLWEVKFKDEYYFIGRTNWGNMILRNVMTFSWVIIFFFGPVKNNQLVFITIVNSAIQMVRNVSLGWSVRYCCYCLPSGCKYHQLIYIVSLFLYWWKLENAFLKPFLDRLLRVCNIKFCTTEVWMVKMKCKCNVLEL